MRFVRADAMKRAKVTLPKLKKELATICAAKHDAPAKEPPTHLVEPTRSCPDTSSPLPGNTCCNLPQPWPTCKTCGASNPTCEEDLEKPGTYYCARCWDVYEEEVRVIVGVCTATLF